MTDGDSFWDERHLDTTTELVDPDGLAIRVTNTEPGGRFVITKDIITDPSQSALLMRCRLEGADGLRLFVLCAPHLEIGSYGNTGRVEKVVGDRTVLTATNYDTWLALGASVPITTVSAGYVGVKPLDVWKPNRRIGTVKAGRTLRIQAPAPFTLVWAAGDDRGESMSVSTRLGIHYVDIEMTGRVRFTFGRGEGLVGEEHTVDIEKGTL